MIETKIHELKCLKFNLQNVVAHITRKSYSKDTQFPVQGFFIGLQLLIQRTLSHQRRKSQEEEDTGQEEEEEEDDCV